MTLRCLATRATALSAALFLLSATRLPAQSGSRAAMPTGAAISPDGTLVAWTLGPAGSSTLHLTAGRRPRPRQGAPDLPQRRDRLRQHIPNLVARRPNPRLPLHLHRHRRQARPGADLSVVQIHRRASASSPTSPATSSSPPGRPTASPSPSSSSKTPPAPPARWTR